MPGQDNLRADAGADAHGMDAGRTGIEGRFDGIQKRAALKDGLGLFLGVRTDEGIDLIRLAVVGGADLGLHVGQRGRNDPEMAVLVLGIGVGDDASDGHLSLLDRAFEPGIAQAQEFRLRQPGPLRPAVGRLQSANNDEIRPGASGQRLHGQRGAIHTPTQQAAASRGGVCWV